MSLAVKCTIAGMSRLLDFGGKDVRIQRRCAAGIVGQTDGVNDAGFFPFSSEINDSVEFTVP